MSGGYTPGPWRINRIAATNIESPNGRSVAATGGFQDGTEDSFLTNQANARLIAAAPELVEALRECAAMLKAHKIDCVELHSAAALLARIEGGEA
jgi:hypothetical protein